MKTKRSIVIAVDFGTTFSGVAWAQSANPDTHYIINQWPQNSSASLDGMTSEKVPSDVAYKYEQSRSICLWGFQIPDIMPRMQWIKLGLCPDQKLGIGSRLSSTYSDCRRIPNPYHASPEEVVTDYLRSLREHTVNVLKSKVGSAFDGMALEFVITVPAMWPEKAKVKTLSCAEKAGLGEISRIRIISEPEAAAIHALCASNPHGLEVGDTIVICDAGGGTVDLITFTILELEPNLRLKEEAPGTGALCGSTFLNRRFEEFLEQRFSSIPGWGRDTLDEALHRFETVAKRTFGGDTNDEFMFPVPGLTDDRQIGVHRGRLRVTGQEMKDLFLPILKDVYELVDEQIQASKNQVKSVFLVGGFGQNPYLRRYLHESISEVQILAPVDGWTAVVRGALSKALAESCSLTSNISVDSRMARKHYGTTDNVTFIPGFHDEMKKYWHYFHGEYRIQVMFWFLHKGDLIKETEPIMTSWHQQRQTEYGEFDSIPVNIYEFDSPNGEAAPLYLNRRVKKHATLNPRLDRILKSRISVVRGADGMDYYQVDYKISAAYFSAHCEYALWFEGKNHGSVKVDYA